MIKTTFAAAVLVALVIFQTLWLFVSAMMRLPSASTTVASGTARKIAFGWVGSFKGGSLPASVLTVYVWAISETDAPTNIPAVTRNLLIFFLTPEAVCYSWFRRHAPEPLRLWT